jgi:hypothetical protein
MLVDNNSADTAKKLTIFDEEIARFDSILSHIQEHLADYYNSSNYLNGGFN